MSRIEITLPGLIRIDLIDGHILPVRIFQLELLQLLVDRITLSGSRTLANFRRAGTVRAIQSTLH
ncbi:hypothetical protein D3870_13830 [Noviherbaspirillum cavernae]|uniref:Uncharacterized protein n=1 Tax=Noviherbaspirillum cavernae TaxID=2320862 RepID=A0A418X3A1_9BURK|nr:hypothetical protein D3870_13830 [Noviherbaspirillum cavernae]